MSGSRRELGTPGHCLPVLALTLSPAQQGPGNYTDTFKLLIRLKIIPRSGREAGPHALPGCSASLLPSAGTGQPRGHWHPSAQWLSLCLGHQHPSIHGKAIATSLLASPEGLSLAWGILPAAFPRCGCQPMEPSLVLPPPSPISFLWLPHTAPWEA